MKSGSDREKMQRFEHLYSFTAVPSLNVFFYPQNSANIKWTFVCMLLGCKCMHNDSYLSYWVCSSINLGPLARTLRDDFGQKSCALFRDATLCCSGGSRDFVLGWQRCSMRLQEGGIGCRCSSLCKLQRSFLLRFKKTLGKYVLSLQIHLVL